VRRRALERLRAPAWGARGGRELTGTTTVATFIQPTSSNQYPTPQVSQTFDGLAAPSNEGTNSCPLGSVKGPRHSGQISGCGKTGTAGIAEGWYAMARRFRPSHFWPDSRRSLITPIPPPFASDSPRSFETISPARTHSQGGLCGRQPETTPHQDNHHSDYLTPGPVGVDLRCYDHQRQRAGVRRMRTAGQHADGARCRCQAIP
jgi:hypothetical protein